MNDLLIAHGWQFNRAGGGHFIYAHPEFDEPFSVPSTPSDRRALKNDIARLRRLHPDSDLLKPRRSGQKRYRHVAGAFGSDGQPPAISDELAGLRAYRATESQRDEVVSTSPVPGDATGSPGDVLFIRSTPKREWRTKLPGRKSPVVTKFVCPLCGGGHPRVECKEEAA